MGRITPSFRQLYHELIFYLKKNYQDYLRDEGNREAFDLLLKESWGPENHAMAQSMPACPTVEDTLNIMANVHNRKLIEEQFKKLEESDKIIKVLQERVKKLEQIISKINW